VTLNLAIDNDVRRFGDIIERCLGLHFDEGKRDFLAELLHARTEKNNELNADYLRRLESDDASAEWRSLGQLLTVPETYFFRHFDQFRAFSEVALADRMTARAGSKRLSILSLGCASGEETYSLAVMVKEAMLDASWTVSILGVDLNPAVIEKAVSGRYTDWSLRETSPEVRQKWFQRQGREYVLDPAICSAVRFEERNLSEEAADFWRPEAYDVIFCRNMMMYFAPERARELVARITRALAPGGYLFLGHAETLRGLSQDFHLCHTHETFYYRRRASGETVSPGFAYAPVSSWLPPPLTAVLEGNDSWIDAIQRSSDRIQVLADAPATVADSSYVVKASHWDLSSAFELLRQERFAEALAAIKGLPPEAATDSDTLLLKAVLCAHSGQYAEAEKVCRHLLEFDELNAGARYVLALCCEGTGDNRAAVEHDQAAVYLDGGFAMPRLHLGLLSRRVGDSDTARRELEQALHLLQREEPSRLLLFGGGFGREALLVLCRAELIACGERV
jgi:chemotaxis protein methyltransferase CheR